MHASDSWIIPFMDRLADAASEVVLPHFRTSMDVTNKADGHFDPVTAADRAAEEVMRRIIGEAYPSHGVLGEEFESTRLDAEYVWVVDPIDGTRAFISGLPVWGTLIGLTRDGRPIAGMMAQPFTGERFFGANGQAGYRGPGGARTLRTRACSALSEATLFTTSPRIFQAEEQATYDRIEARVRLARYGCDCYAYSMVAAGNVDLVIESGLKAFDIVALIPIIEGAGGTVTTWTGGDAREGGRIVASGDPRVHDEALRALATA